MNTNTQTVDERCHKLAELGRHNAIRVQCHRENGTSSDCNMVRAQIYANRIITERTRELEAKS